MIFVRLAQLIAWILVLLSVFRVVTTVYLLEFKNSSQELIARYVGPGSSGEIIDQGLIWFAVGVAFGLAAEATKSLLTISGDHEN